MKNLLLCKVLMSLACLTILSLPAKAESVGARFKKEAKETLKYHSPISKKIKGGGKTCWLGNQSVWDAVIITRVTEFGATNGFFPGDKMLKVDGKEITADNRNQLFSRYSPGDSLSISIERNGAVIDIDVVCGDGTERDNAFISMVQAAAKGRWQECLDQSYKADELNGAKLSFTAHYRQSSHEAKRCGSFGCKEPTIETSRLLYDTEILRLEEAVIANKLGDIRSRVLSSISWLEKYGSRQFASELKAALYTADSGPASRIAERASPQQPSTGYGTCFAVSNTEVLTSHHVVANTSLITVKFRDGVERGAVVVQQSQSTDLALLKVNGVAPSFLPLAPMRSIEVGQEVFTVGFPVTAILGSEAKFTEGSVSAVSGVQGDASFFQMSVPIQPGNSGGPVLNMNGEVVGVVASTAAIEAFYSMSGSLPQNVNWASKSDHARLLFEPPSLIEKASSRTEAIEMAYSAVCKVKVVLN